jgi:hypothetical protein
MTYMFNFIFTSLVIGFSLDGSERVIIFASNK